MSDWTPDRIRALRKRLGLTQVKFGRKLGQQTGSSVAVSRKTVWQWESGRATPAWYSAAALDALERAVAVDALERAVAAVAALEKEADSTTTP